MIRKKVAIIGVVGIPASYGGFETLADCLTQELNQEVDFTVYCSSISYSAKLKTYNGAKLKYIPLSANGKWSIIYDIISVIHSLQYADTLLVLGVGSSFILPFVRIFTKKRIVINIDGLEWKRDKWGFFTKWYLLFQEYLAVKSSHTVISDNLGIKEYVKGKYGRDSILIAYGGNHCFSEQLSEEVISKFSIEFPYAFAVCRIEPENNIHIILEAFSSVKINLILIGNWNNSEYGISLRSKYGKHQHIKLLDPIYNRKILNQIRSNCRIYIHGHSAGGTNPSLVEAMWLGLPIFAWDVNYNRYTTSNTALFFSSVDHLVDLLSNISSDQIQAMRDKVRDIAQAEYSWTKIAQSYQSLF